MSIKEEVIRETIRRIKKELKDINFILESNPLSDIITLQQEAIGKALKMDSEERIKYLKIQVKKEKKLFALARKQQDTIKFIDRKVKLDNELNTLKYELFRLTGA